MLAKAALEQLRHDTAGLIDDHFDDLGVHSVDVVSYACDQPNCPEFTMNAETAGKERDWHVTIFPDGQGPRFAYTLIHELLHAHGLMHTGPGLNVMASANVRSLDFGLQSTCLHVEDQRELCRVFGCKVSALPPACVSE